MFLLTISLYERKLNWTEYGMSELNFKFKNFFVIHKLNSITQKISFTEQVLLGKIAVSRFELWRECGYIYWIWLNCIGTDASSVYSTSGASLSTCKWSNDETYPGNLISHLQTPIQFSPDLSCLLVQIIQLQKHTQSYIGYHQPSQLNTLIPTYTSPEGS